LAPTDEELERLLAQSREELEPALEKVEGCVKAFQRCLEMRVSLAFIDAQLQADPASSGFDLKGEFQRAQGDLQAAKEEVRAACPSLLAHLAGSLARLAGTIPRSWLETLRLLEKTESLLNALAWELSAMGRLRSVIDVNPENTMLLMEIGFVDNRLEGLLKQLAAAYGDAPHPLEDSGTVTLTAHLLGEPSSYNHDVRAANNLNLTHQLQAALLGRIAASVEGLGQSAAAAARSGASSAS